MKKQNRSYRVKEQKDLSETGVKILKSELALRLGASIEKTMLRIQVSYIGLNINSLH